MSVNQSRGDKYEPPHYRRSGRSVNHASPMNFSGDGGKGGGGGSGSTTAPPSSAFSSGTPDASSTGVTVKPTDASVQKSSPCLPKVPQSHAVTPISGTTGATGPATPVKGDTSKAFPLQFGSISPGVMNGMQVPARTNSGPPNMDEQKRAQARLDSLKATSFTNPAVPKQQLPRKDVGPANQKKDVSAPIAAHNQKPTGPPMPSIPGVSMQIPFHQSQIHLPFGGPNPPLQSQNMANTSLPVPLPMHLPVGNPQQVPPQVFVQGIQHHHHQGMIHPSQGLTFSSQIGNMGMPMGLGPQFQQQPTMANLNSGGARRTVKITVPDTHEELRQDKRTDGLYPNGGSSGGPRSHPQGPPQSQTVPSFPTAHPTNYYPNSYNANPVYFPPHGKQNTPGSQPRFFNQQQASKQVTVKPAVCSHGANHGVLRTPRGQPPGQYAGGILSRPMQPHGPQGGHMQLNNSDSDMWQRATGYQKGLMPSPHTPVMHKPERKYEVGKITDEEQAKQRQLKGIINKLMPQNFEKLFEQVKQVNIDNAITLSGVIGQIFDKYLMEPTFVEIYANFCSRLSDELPDFNEDNEKITFKRLLLNKCQEEFERGMREQEEGNRTEEEGEVKQMEEQREEKRVKARRRKLSNIRLIGELYKKKMLTERIMHECIHKLLGQYQDPDEEDIESLCILMSTIGEMIDHPKTKEHMDAYFDMMYKLSNNMQLSSRVRFMLKDAIDLRKNKWQQRRKVKGPKKIDEVHRDAAQERQAQSSRLAHGPNSNPSIQRGGQIDFDPKLSNVFPSNPQMGGFRGLPQQQLRGYGNQDPRFDSFENRNLSVPLRPMGGDDSITLGPQGGLARGMSVRGQPSMQGMPLHDMDSRRGFCGPNGYGAILESPSYGPRDDLGSRYMSDRFSPRPVDDPSCIQEHNMNNVNRDTRNTGLGFDLVSPFSPSERTLVSAPPQSGPSDKVLSEDHLRNMSIAAIKEFYGARDEKEVALCIKDLNAPSFYPTMISIWVTDSFERKDMDRDALAKLLINLAKSHDRILSQDSFVKGFESVLSTLEDAVKDAPKAAEFLGRMFARILLENVVPYEQVWRLIYEGGEEQGQLVEVGLAAEVLGVILEIIKSEKGDPLLKDLRENSNPRLENFRSPTMKMTSRLDKFI